MKNAIVVTPFVAEERRMMAAFAAEMERFGLEVNTKLIGGHYAFDEETGQRTAFAEFETRPFPVAGSRKKMDEISAAGYRVDVYVPYGWGRRRGFRVTVSRPVIMKEA